LYWFLTTHNTCTRAPSQYSGKIVVNQGNVTATIIWFAITTGITAGLSYNKEKE